MLAVPLSLRHALRLGAHAGTLHRVRAALEAVDGPLAYADAPRIDRGRLVVARHLADATARELDALGLDALADRLHVEALRGRAVRAG